MFSAFLELRFRYEKLCENLPRGQFWTLFEQKTWRKSTRRAAMDTFDPKKLAVEFFIMDAPNPSPLTQNSCLARFWSFGTGMKNCAKIGSEGRSGHFWYEKTCSRIF